MEVYPRLENIFRIVFGDEAIQLVPETEAADIDGWDSVSHINLMVSIEQSFGITFTSEEMASFKTVGDLADLLGRKTGLPVG